MTTFRQLRVENERLEAELMKARARVQKLESELVHQDERFSQHGAPGVSACTLAMDRLVDPLVWQYTNGRHSLERSILSELQGEITREAFRWAGQVEIVDQMQHPDPSQRGRLYRAWLRVWKPTHATPPRTDQPGADE